MNEVQNLKLEPQLPAWVMTEIVEWMGSGKYGYLQLNTQLGKIININKHETVKPEQAPKP